MTRLSHATPRAAARVAAVWLTAAGLLAVSAGCSDFENFDMRQRMGMSSQRTDLVATGRVAADAASGPALTVSKPTVYRERDMLVVRGVVTRGAGVDTPIPGFLDLQIIGKDGQLIDESLLHWVPESVPVDGGRLATYSARLLGVPPAGSTVRVSYVEKFTDLTNAPEGAPGGGSAAGRGAAGGHSGGHSGAGHSLGSGSSGGSGFGSSFGNSAASFGSGLGAGSSGGRK